MIQLLPDMHDKMSIHTKGRLQLIQHNNLNLVNQFNQISHINKLLAKNLKLLKIKEHIEGANKDFKKVSRTRGVVIPTPPYLTFQVQEHQGQSHQIRHRRQQHPTRRRQAPRDHLRLPEEPPSKREMGQRISSYLFLTLSN
jgi:hypothetical protein